MSWRDALSICFGPGAFSGVPLGDWLRVLWENRFAYPNFYQVTFPHTFLSTEQMSGKLVGFFLPKTRPQDNVRLGVNEPQEDEFAICCLTRLSHQGGMSMGASEALVSLVVKKA